MGANVGKFEVTGSSVMFPVKQRGYHLIRVESLEGQRFVAERRERELIRIYRCHL